MSSTETYKYSSNKLIDLGVITSELKKDLFGILKNKKKVLITGKSGEGKTILANCLIDEAIDFDTKVYVRQALDELYLENKERKIENISSKDFVKAIEKAVETSEKCIFVFDESGGLGHSSNSKATSKILDLIGEVHDIPIIYIMKKPPEGMSKYFDATIFMEEFKVKEAIYKQQEIET